MSFGIERAGTRHLDHVAAPFSLGAVELDVCSSAAQPFPRCQRKVLHLAHADAAVDRNPFRFHEQVIGCLRPAELAEAGPVLTGRFVPMRPAGQFVHAEAFGGGNSMSALLPGLGQGKARW